MTRFYKQLLFISLGVAILVAGGVLIFARTKTITIGGFGATTTATCDIDPASCVNSGLVGYWAMDEMGSTTVKDLSGNNNNGLLGGGTAAARPTWAQGVQPFSGGRAGGGALKFDGVDDYVKYNGNNTGMSGNFSGTLSAWIYPTALPASPSTIAGLTSGSGVIGDSFAFFIGGKGAGSVGIAFDACEMDTATGIIQANRWYHIVAVKTPGKISTATTFYIDGRVIATSYQYNDCTPALNATAMRAGAGWWNGDTQLPYQGFVDDVRIYNRALSAVEVQYQYNQAKPIGWWKMDEGSGNYAYDSSGNANTGTLYNPNGSPATSSMWVSGVYGTGLQFDGVDDYVDAGNGASFNLGQGAGKQWTVSLWYYAKGTATTPQFLVSKRTNQSLNQDYGFFTETNILYWGTGSGADANGAWMNIAEPSRNTWHHIVGTLISSGTETGTKSLYVDGVLRASANYTKKSNIVADTLKIGSENGQYYFNGLIDDVRIYNYARTASQIRQDYNDGKAMYVGVKAPSSCDVDPASCINKGLVGYWSMDEMGSTTVKDLSGNNNNGLLGGGTAAARPTWAQGVQPFSGGRPGGGALKFDGVDDWVSINSDLLGVGDITVCAWIKPTVIGSTNRRIVDNIKTEFYVDTAGTLGFISDGGGTDTYSATGIIEINKWHYVCVSRNSIALTANFYLNGVLRNGADVSLRGVSGSTYTIIGNNLVNQRQFNGSIDGVRIYNRALSEAEIRYQYNEGKPIAWWKMDEGANSSTTCNATTSNVYDYSGNGNTGALSLGGSPATSTAWTDGKFGCALQFDGTDDQVSVTSTNFNITGTITIGTWIYWTSGRANERFIMKGAVNSSGWSLYSSATNQASFVINNSYSAPVTITLNRWTYLVGVYNKSDVRIYKDGVLQGTPTVYSSDIVNIDNLVRIGYDTTGAHHFSGSLDDVRIYNYARTPDQIRQDYTAGSALHLTQ